jgi:uncharacterized membrane protein HdeD (DUF308 family)
MPKKRNYDQTIKKVEGITNKVNVIMRNRLIIAFFLIVDGITFLLNPESSLPEMARNIILIILFAAFTVLVTSLLAKEKDKKTIAISIAILIVGAIFYFYPDIISAYMQLLLALFIIYDGLANIAKVLNLSRMQKYTQTITEKYNKYVNRKLKNKEKEERREKFKTVDDNINVGLEEQKEKMVTPLKNLVNKTSNSPVLYIIANATSVVLGIVLLIFPDVSMMVWGIIFLYTGLSNFIVSVRTMNLSKKIKERKFKEIIFEAEKKEEKEEKLKKKQEKRQADKPEKKSVDKPKKKA